ncbi:hypothetical protein [Sulfurimonas sp.]|uniref:hypothetical protein n=1 Tax=Sulfurimonas sp. TaxID=2022749 RepID=UPI0019FDE18B|nr:hypothetical protein [Sulfurimonas sp.]MBE0515730.1 hypothetical protein [Sulfurimonas sp.]
MFGQAKSEKGFEYGAVHQWGSSKKKIPSRKFLPLDESGVIAPRVYEEIKEAVTNEFKNSLNP